MHKSLSDNEILYIHIDRLKTTLPNFIKNHKI